MFTAIERPDILSLPPMDDTARLLLLRTLAPPRLRHTQLHVSSSHDHPGPPPIERAAGHEHRTFLEKTQELAQVGSWIADLSGSDRLSWSAETHRIFDIAIGAFEGTSAAFFRFVHPDDRETVRAAARSAIEKGKPYDVEYRITTAAGQVRWVHEKGDVIRDPDGRPLRMIGTAQDISDRRRLEEQLRHSQKMEALGRLAGGVAHDLNNALTTIAGYTALALAELADDHPARADVEEVRRAAARAESVTRQLLAFSRKHLVEPRVINLNEILEGVTRLLAHTLGGDVTLRTVKDPALPAIVGDPGQLEQAIVNLATNARDAMPGGGEVVVSTSVVDVDEAFARAHEPMTRGRYVMLSVADTGQGLTAETKARIFEPFFTTKAVGKGTGLGLAMVYGMVKNCGAFVFVDSEPGQGATFRMYFPAALEAARSEAAPSRTDSDTSTPRTVLVVEDEQAILNLIVTALTSEGHHILKATSSRVALDVVAANGGVVDLVLTDATMPGMGGVELARELRATRPDLVVIIMSGYTQEEISGFDGGDRTMSMLQKPFTPVELRVRVREALAGARR
jgi:two-component system cell cycle sensor histidine kinase/response regulator CckA